MNQAISNAMLFNLVITFVVVLLALFVGSLSYSKASKVKNYIIEEIEKYGEDATNQGEIDKAYENASAGILEWLNHGDGAQGIGIGYRQVRNGVRTCPDPSTISSNDGVSAENVTNEGLGSAAINPYEYCVYRVQSCPGAGGTDCYTYYKVRTYMYFDVPIIEDLIKIPVDGETRGFEFKNN